MAKQRTIDDTAWESEDEHLAPALILVHHPDERQLGRRCALAEGARLLLGRGSGALGAGLLDDSRISGEHALLTRRRGVVALRDMGSRNGTRVNGVRIRSCKLGNGDLVSVGSLLFVLRHEPALPACPPVRRMVGISSALALVVQQISQVAPRPATVLVLGEPGVGKELVAREIHSRSGRKGACLAINCGAMSDELLQSELFGHLRGAFSGAGTARQGLVAAAAGGTLFLDEIGDASPALQASLLRLLEYGEYRPLGSDRVLRADVRVVAATNRLELGRGPGMLREDLYGRLSRWLVEVPPLRVRIEDIPVLAMHFARSHVAESVSLDHRLAQLLCMQPWPGNVRELASVMERIAVESGGAERLLPPRELLATLGLRLRSGASREDDSSGVQRRGPPGADELRQGLIRCSGSMKELAARLGVGRTTLYRWFAAANLDPETVRREVVSQG